MKASFVEVTPEQAKRWLGYSKINRTIREAKIIAYSEAMRRGDWRPTDAGIGFTKDGELINGHHRLNAIVRAGVPVELLVVQDLPNEAKGVIDCGISRTLNDQLRMFRTSTTNITRRTAAVKICARLLCGREVSIVSLEDFDRWARPFRDGLEWAVNLFSNDRHVLTSPVFGALAFAYRSDSETIAAFGERLHEGVDLSRGSPEITLRRLLTSERGLNQAGEARLALARKTLNAALAAIEGRDLNKIQDGRLGLDFFLKAYATSSVDKLAEAWL